eukprot:6491480-Amphidinium_carterae.2
MDSASALDHYEEVNALMEEVLFDSWEVHNTERPASWHEGFTQLLQELNGRLLEETIAYPTAQGDIQQNPYELFQLVKEKASYMEIDDFIWSLSDNRCHTTDPDSHGRMEHLRRADADARGLTPTVVEDEPMNESAPELLPKENKKKAVIGPEAHLKDSSFYGSSRHLQVGVYNLGTLDRRWMRHQADPPILKMLRDQPNQLQLLCEGQMFAKHGWD